MKFTPLSSKDFEYLCDIYEAEKYDSQAELLEDWRELGDMFPDSRILLTLDNLGQAQYTSMHSKGSHDLDETEGYDLSSLDAICFEDGEHVGYLSSKSEFFIRLGNFEKLCKESSLERIFQEKNLLLNDESLSELISAQENWLSILDDSIYAFRAIVNKAEDSLAAFPNGYFSSDLNPFENHALCRHLRVNYGYSLMGIGASYLALLRESQLSPSQASDLTDILLKLYGEKAMSWIELVMNKKEESQHVLVLRYTE
ncbi:hypothetical protein [Undibacterium pigrum]|uniref:Uncharacterized protein n=1 Tax=Undibacterium pigrum TaxID=401470 RepID=A0A318JZW5_9BURK|nr:hypothetical protein [Undibacterium pigrum]PXX46584.1 hypothetical protein DFR42_101154 [Undibacterium pigrum]